MRLTGNMLILILYGSVFTFLLISSCAEKHESVIGVRTICDYQIELTTRDSREIDPDLVEEIFDELEGEVSMLDPHEGSVLGNLNTSETGELIETDSVGEVIINILQYTESCYGAFDPTLQILWDVYDFELGGRYVSEVELTDALRWVDYRVVELDGGRIFRKNEISRMGLGPVLPGAIVDLFHESLSNRGVEFSTIRVGQCFLFAGSEDDEDFIYDFRMPLEKIDPDSVQLTVGYVRLYRGEYLAALDDDENFFFTRGEQYHMIISPDTGKPVREVRAAVVVSDESCLQASVYAYAVMVMGLERGLEFLDETEGVEGLIFSEDTEIHVSSGLGERFWR